MPAAAPPASATDETPTHSRAAMGISTRAIETLLTERALDFLAGGPAEAVALIEHVCQMPGAPRVVAEQMAIALFAGHPEFARDEAGRWCLAPRGGGPAMPVLP